MPNSINAQHAIVIDEQGCKVEFILVYIVQDGDGYVEVPQHYTLGDGERIMYGDVSIPLSMYKPCWSGTTWEETATTEEIATAEVARLKVL